MDGEESNNSGGVCDRELDFEKLHLQSRYLQPGYSRADIYLANVPHDWSQCSVVVTIDRADCKRDDVFAHVFLNAAELDQVIAALQEIRRDMP